MRFRFDSETFNTSSHQESYSRRRLVVYSIVKTSPPLIQSFKSHFVQRKMSTQKWQPNIELYTFYILLDRVSYMEQNMKHVRDIYLYMHNNYVWSKNKCISKQTVIIRPHRKYGIIYDILVICRLSKWNTHRTNTFLVKGTYNTTSFIVAREKYTQTNGVRLHSVRGFGTFRGCRRTGQKNRIAKGERTVERKRCSAYYILSPSLYYPHTHTYGLCIFPTNKDNTWA